MWIEIKINDTNKGFFDLKKITMTYISTRGLYIMFDNNHESCLCYYDDPLIQEIYLALFSAIITGTSYSGDGIEITCIAKRLDQN